MEKSTTKFLWRYSKMEENNVVMELETETVPAEETYDESNGGSTLIGVAIGVAGTLGAQWLYKKALKPLGGKIKDGIEAHKAKKLAKKASKADTDNDSAEE
jgi:hypothetical protein